MPRPAIQFSISHLSAFGTRLEMSFTRRNVAIRTPAQRGTPSDASNTPSQPTATPATAPKAHRLPGTRPSPVDGRPTTSTGCLSLDGLLAGHAGLALGTSLLIGETGTTDYASTLLRYYAAEGVVQGHKLHVVGFPESWGRDLPAAIGPAHAGDQDKKVSPQESERMKIAWRYERLGEFGAGNSRSRSTTGEIAKNDTGQPEEPFCHAFDLTKRLTFPSADALHFIPITPYQDNPFDTIKQTLIQAIKSSPAETVHRILIPSLLSPALYPPQCSDPTFILPFLHSLRALLRTDSTRLSLVLSLPLTLYPRETGLTRWIELLSDGVLELVPFPHSFDNEISNTSLGSSGAATALEERPQGMLHVHRLPVFHERGGGGVGSAGVEDDLAFTVSRRKFVIKPFSLPPVEGDTEAQKGDAEAGGSGMPRKEDLEF